MLERLLAVPHHIFDQIHPIHHIIDQIKYVPDLDLNLTIQKNANITSAIAAGLFYML